MEATSVQVQEPLFVYFIVLVSEGDVMNGSGRVSGEGLFGSLDDVDFGDSGLEAFSVSFFANLRKAEHSAEGSFGGFEFTDGSSSDGHQGDSADGSDGVFGRNRGVGPKGEIGRCLDFF